MNYITYLLLIFISVNTFGQSFITPQLQQRMQMTKPGEKIRIRLEFDENVDCYLMNQLFKHQKTPLDKRAKAVITSLQETAKKSQAPVLDLIRSKYKLNAGEITPFWIVNIMVLEADQTLIDALKKIEGIALIDEEYNKFIPHDPIQESAETRSPGGTESGLRAINADKLWALGYTGKGTLVYNYDTGVWPNHPSYANRFMGKKFPMSQSWLGFFNQLPNGSVNDHGTHTLGTMAGLDTMTHDTIGVAFKAYWIANDFVTSSVSTLPPITEMIKAFEWALNPDGDVNTSDDIPDVINNSWRWYDEPDTAYCGGYVVSLFNAIEAVGIANVFSGGNHGPSNTTISSPQRINTSEVNTFCVGSINANLSWPYPLSSFSSLGPKQCPGSGSLLIHPEVVAPGQNVRSAWGQDEYNTISGTSMAAPHVSGAVLLLKEAFPYLTGEELLWALYLTARDMGSPGEDNTYGMGLIDVFEAFNYLSQTNTPVVPNVNIWDVSISDVSNLSELVTCKNTFSTEIIASNSGTETINDLIINYWLNDSAYSYNWNGNLLPGQSTLIQLPAATTNETGSIAFRTFTEIPGIFNEYDLYDNHTYTAFNKRAEFSLPFREDFENGFEADRWALHNEDGSLSWDTLSTGGLEWNNVSATVQLYDYFPRANQKDLLISPTLILPSGVNTLKFDLSYQKRSSSSFLVDTFQIFISTDCENFENNMIYEKYGDVLETFDTISGGYTPEYSGHWRRDSVDLSFFSGQNINITFRTVNRGGNNIYIDNILVYNGLFENQSVPDIANFPVSIYPNPTENILWIESSIRLSGLAKIYDMSGKLVAQKNMKDKLNHIDTGHLNKGLYICILEQNGLKRVLKFNKI